MMVVNGWETKRLTDLAEYINGYAFKPDDWGKDGLPIIRIEQLKNPESINDFFSGRLPDANIIDNGDLIFSWSASLFLRIWQYGKAALNQHLFKVVEKKGVDRLFLKSFIEFHLPEIKKASHGSTMQHITRKELDRFATLFPEDKAEQTKIAEVLSTVDRAIEQTEALIAKQQRTKTGLMQDLLTRGIDEHGDIRSEETHQFKDSPLGRIPVEWEITTLGVSVGRDGGSVQTGPFGSQLHAEDYKDEGIPIITVEHLGDSKILHSNLPLVGEADYKRLKKYTINEGDLVFSRVGAIDRCSYVGRHEDGWLFSGRCLRVRSGNNINSIYLAYQLNYDKARNWILNNSVGTTMACLNTSILSMVPILLPNSDEQLKIAGLLDDISDAISHELLKKEKLILQKTGLMQDLLTGKVRVTELLK